MTMKTVFVPVLIETAEQAEALPIGTVLLHLDSQGGVDQAGVVQRGYVEYSGVREEFPDDMAVGDLALVPVEAEEEHAHMYARRAHGDMYTTPPRQELPGPARRLVTPWEPA